MEQDVILETPRLLLREFTAQDADALEVFLGEKTPELAWVEQAFRPAVKGFEGLASAAEVLGQAALGGLKPGTF